MTTSTTPESRPSGPRSSIPQALRVGLHAEDGSVIHVRLGADPDSAVFESATSDALRLVRLSREPARVLLDVRYVDTSAPFRWRALRTMVASLRDSRAHVAVVCGSRGRRALLRLLLVRLGGGAVSLCPTESSAFKWLKG